MNITDNIFFVRYLHFRSVNIRDHIFSSWTQPPIMVPPPPKRWGRWPFWTENHCIFSVFFLRVIQNYIMFSVAASYSKLLTEDFIHLSKNLSIATDGVYKELPRWKICTLKTNSGMGMALGSLFVQKTFAQNSYQEVRNLNEYLCHVENFPCQQMNIMIHADIDILNVIFPMSTNEYYDPCWHWYSHCYISNVNKWIL